MKVKDLVKKLNASSNVRIRMKTDINDPGVILAWRYQKVLCGGNCTVKSFEINGNEMTIYYKPIPLDV